MDYTKVKETINELIISLCGQAKFKAVDTQSRAYAVEIAQLTQGLLNISAAEKQEKE